jgi:hypothetical protein
MAAARVRLCYVASVENTEFLRKLKQVEDNAWILFNELPPCGARTRALHVFLDAKALTSRLEKMPEATLADQPDNR